MGSQATGFRMRWIKVFITLVLTTILCACGGNPAGNGSTQGDDASPDTSQVNRIKWSTKREVNNLGFNVMRGDTEAGPFFKINEEPIRGAGTTAEIRRYEFIDDSIDPTRTYYYYVESITVGGREKRFTPILKAPPKQPQKPESHSDLKPEYP